MIYILSEADKRKKTPTFAQLVMSLDGLWFAVQGGLLEVHHLISDHEHRVKLKALETRAQTQVLGEALIAFDNHSPMALLL